MRSDGTFEPKDALIGIVVAAIVADGRRVRAEVDAGSRELATTPDFRVTWTDVATRLEWLGGMADRDGLLPFVDRCIEALPAHLAAAAFRAAAKVTTADGALAPVETDFLLVLAAKLGVSARLSG